MAASSFESQHRAGAGLRGGAAGRRRELRRRRAAFARNHRRERKRSCAARGRWRGSRHRRLPLADLAVR
eukprot:4502757-Alexandrium_andersonii.AAC.1